MTTTQTPPLHSIVEWYAQPSSVRTGIVGNLPAERRIGQVWRYSIDGTIATVYDQDGVRCHVAVDRLTVIAERAEDGWGNLA